MLFVYLMSSALAASMVFGGSTQPTHVSYDEAELRARQDHTAVVRGVAVDSDGRTANLKFVLAIQRSTMWTDIKRRTVRISTNPRLAALLDADPDSLSDEDLALLRRACHDGLKCVAVDQLLVLRSATRKLPNGMMAVRKVITKITHVLTNYTTEYYEDTYQYEEVSESDDPSKVEESVTVIVEDNKELCGIKVGDDVAVMEDETVSTTVARDAQKVVEGAVSVSLDGGDDAAAKENATKTPAAKETPKATPTVKPSAPAAEPSAPAAEPSAPAAEPSAPAAKPSAPAAKPSAPAAKPSAPVAKPSAPAAKPTTADKVTRSGGEGDAEADDDYEDELRRRLAQANGQARRGGDPARRNAAAAPTAARISPKWDDNNGDYNENGEEDEDDDALPASRPKRSVAMEAEDDDAAGDSTMSVDVANAGDRNVNAVRKGYVEDGVINNGNMNMYNTNRGTVNKGIVNRSAADGGIVNVGTLNNGPTVYGAPTTADGRGDDDDDEGYGSGAKMNDDEMMQYMSSIDKMYSTIMESLAKQ